MLFKGTNAYTFQYIKFVTQRNFKCPVLKGIHCHTLELNYTPLSNKGSLKVSE